MNIIVGARHAIETPRAVCVLTFREVLVVLWCVCVCICLFVPLLKRGLGAYEVVNYPMEIRHSVMMSTTIVMIIRTVIIMMIMFGVILMIMMGSMSLIIPKCEIGACVCEHAKDLSNHVWPRS